MGSRKLPSFLRSAEAALTWAEKNTDVTSQFDDDDMDDPEYAEAVREQLLELAGEYADFAQEAFATGIIPIYRMVRVRSTGDVRLDRLGKYWSRYREGAGVQGRPYGGGRTDILIEGIIRPWDVHWEHGLESFMIYGEDQWEVAAKPNAPILITAVDGKPLVPPVKGNAGPFASDVGWKPNTEMHSKAFRVCR